MRLRHIPLVMPLPFLLGHMWTFVANPMYLCYEQWAKQYGGFFLVFFGKNPVVVLTDPDLMRQVAVKHFAKFHDRPSFVPVPHNKNKRLVALRSGLLVSRGGYWGSLRAALNPLFHTSALHSYSPIINDSATHLLERLDGVEEGPLDIHALLGRMTMQVIGRTAFGVEFVTDKAEEDHLAGRPNLVAAVKVIFSTGGFTPGQGIGILFRILPNSMEPLLFTIFFTLVGGVAKRLEYARTTFMATADLLLQAAKRQAEQRGEAVQVIDTDWRWWSQDSAFVQQNPYKGVTPAPNSAIDRLLRATNKETGRGLTDVQIAAQANTLIAAGYETSANALAFTIFCLATHPEAEAQLLAEIDAFGADKEPGLDDLPRFPYVAAVINEALRMYPPAHTTNRECTAVDGCTLEGPDGQQIYVPHGVWVHFNFWGLHHSEQHWTQPYVFRPERFIDEGECAKRHPHAFLPFGLGPRMCIGFKFALQELQISVIRIYQRYTFRLAPGQKADPLPLRMGITLAPRDGLWVTAHKRTMSSSSKAPAASTGVAIAATAAAAAAAPGIAELKA